MAFNTYYSTSITTLEGNTLLYELQKDAVSTTPTSMQITEDSYNLNYFFNDENSTRIGIGVLSKRIKLTFFESNEIDDIKAAPLDWRLKITLDSNVIFTGFPDVQSLTEYILPSFSEKYECTFLNAFSRITQEDNTGVRNAIIASLNPIHATNIIPITDLVGEFITEYYTDETNLVWVSHYWVSDNCIGSLGPPTLRPDPQMRYFCLQIPATVSFTQNRSVGEVLKEVAQAFFLRIGWSHLEGKTIISECIQGASGTFTGYDCTYAASGYRTITSSSNITLQTIATTDFIVDGRDVNAQNPTFPKRLNSTIQSGTENTVENPNTTYSYLFDEEVNADMYWKDDTLSSSDKEGFSVLGRNGADTLDELKVLGDVYADSTLATAYELSELRNERMGSDYLFSYGLKGFKVLINKVLDPMIPISYDSKVYITPEGTINLYEETTDCLLIEIQDNA